ncbi:hypothetical protein ACIPRI_03100 [Variovorax sp. LARHSF232]
MTMTRSFKQWIGRGLIGLLLFAQLAVAAYACPALSQARADSTAAVVVRQQQQPQDMAGMNCEQMAGPADEAAPNLCAEHCRFGQQQGVQPLPQPLPALLVALYVLAPAPAETGMPDLRPATPSDEDLAAAFPPHAILHCCLRT